MDVFFNVFLFFSDMEESPAHIMSTNARIRCRQCRALVSTVDSNDLKDCHLIKYPIRDINAKEMESVDTYTQSTTTRPCATNDDRREVFLVEEVYAIWIQEEIISSGWTKGKLKCMKCASNIGSFDFVSGKKCECKRFDQPPLHFNVSKVDIELSQPPT